MLMFKAFSSPFSLGIVHKLPHSHGGGAQGFYDMITKVSVVKSVKIGRGRVKNVQNSVTSFIDDPLLMQ
jgi:hypothetical protein